MQLSYSNIRVEQGRCFKYSFIFSNILDLDVADEIQAAFAIPFVGGLLDAPGHGQEAVVVLKQCFFFPAQKLICQQLDARVPALNIDAAVFIRRNKDGHKGVGMGNGEIKFAARQPGFAMRVFGNLVQGKIIFQVPQQVAACQKLQAAARQPGAFGCRDLRQGKKQLAFRRLINLPDGGKALRNGRPLAEQGHE